MTSIKSIIFDFLSDGGLNSGDIVLLHSNISKLYKNLLKANFKFKIEDILEIIIEYIGPSGTLIIPTFNFSFCEGNQEHNEENLPNIQNKLEIRLWGCIFLIISGFLKLDG